MEDFFFFFFLFKQFTCIFPDNKVFYAHVHLCIYTNIVMMSVCKKCKNKEEFFVILLVVVVFKVCEP